MLSVQDALLVLGEMLFVAAIPILIWKFLNTNSAEARFWALVGFYVLYMVLMCAVFSLVPGAVNDMVEAHSIAAEAAQKYCVIINVLVFAIPNVVVLICIIAWHCSKRREELSEMDRMKLEDM